MSGAAVVHLAATAALADDVRRELVRVADRLRVLGPRWTQRESPPAEVAAVRSALQQLADLAADAAGDPRRSVPDLALHALADQLLVLGHEVVVVADAATLATVRDVLVGLRRSL